MVFEDLSKKKPKILVIGDLMIDHYLWGEMTRISPEAPVPVVNVKNETITLGGAGNVIKNLKSLDADCAILSVIGTDDNSKIILNEISKLGLDTENVIIDETRTGSKKSRVVVSNQQVLRIDREVTSPISELVSDRLIDQFAKIIECYEIVLVSDYGKGVISESVSNKVISLSNSLNKRVLVDPKGADFRKYEGAYLITPNKKEAYEATNLEILDHESLEDSLKSLKQKYNLDVALITLSEDGIAVYENSLEIFSTKAREIYDVTGAGDTVIASLGYCLASGLKINEAVEFANLAAGVVISKVGSSIATFEEISLFHDSIEPRTKVLIEDQFIKKIAKIKS
ncbi:D-glycero-beta-D-manno-heptose-7-phosphate kinase, partial [Verrucomicrobiales bacterium]|nr:D-glycero-beta-D-manno-heptose-7-phosphate kinase [Verrucomicrobiales bacterium]